MDARREGLATGTYQTSVALDDELRNTKNKQSSDFTGLREPVKKKAAGQQLVLPPHLPAYLPMSLHSPYTDAFKETHKFASCHNPMEPVEQEINKTDKW